MMRLSMMRDFLSSDSTETLLSTLLAKWGGQNESARFFRASSNFVFTFQRNEQVYVLRLTDSYDRSYAEVKAELAYLKFLAERQVPVNQPVPSEEGNEIETCQSELGTFYAVVFPFIKGALYELEELPESHFYQWGKALGALHRNSVEYSMPYFEQNSMQDGTRSCIANDPPSFEKHLAFIRNMVANDDAYMLQELDAIEIWFHSLPKSADQFGVIHFDFELDNLIWMGDRFVAIDFEQCSYSWFAADIAFALRDLFANGCDLQHDKFQCFLKGYREEMTISDADLACIPHFLRFHHLYIYATLRKTIDVNVDTAQNPEWVVNLANRLRKKADQLRKGASCE